MILKYSYWKIILFSILILIFIFLLFRVFTPVKGMSELNNYKIDEINKGIQQIKVLQKNLSDTILEYKSKIDEIDKKISSIKSEKKEITNYYIQKEKEIKGYDNKKIDSLIRSRYDF